MVNLSASRAPAKKELSDEASSNRSPCSLPRSSSGCARRTHTSAARGLHARLSKVLCERPSRWRSHPQVPARAFGGNRRSLPNGNFSRQRRQIREPIGSRSRRGCVANQEHLKLPPCVGGLGSCSCVAGRPIASGVQADRRANLPGWRCLFPMPRGGRPMTG
jgi:hypothetical protein